MLTLQRLPRFVICFCASLSLAGYSLGQNPTDLSLQRGIQPTGAYAVSSQEAVNMVSGNLFVTIPLAQLPADRAGNRFPLNLVYNSQLLDATPSYETWTDDSGNTETLPTTRLTASPEGGWHYAYGYTLQYETRPFADGSRDCSSLQEQYKFRLSVIFPDGSAHILYPRNYVTDGLNDGYFEISYNGTHAGDYEPLVCSNFNVSTGPPTFFTEDGTYVRVQMLNASPDFAHSQYQIFLRDGTTITGESGTISSIEDKNHNTVTITRTQDANFNLQTTIKDDFGRSITLTTGPNINDQISESGFGATLTWTVAHSVVTIAPYTYQCAQGLVSHQAFYCDGSAGFDTISSISIPAISGNNSATTLTYTFQYDTGGYVVGQNDCPNPNPGGACGYGELNGINYPYGGAHVVYGYAAWPKAAPYLFLLNPVVSKTVHWDEVQSDGSSTQDVTEATTYDIHPDGSGGTTTGTDGGQTSTYVYNGVLDWRRGLTYKTVYPDGDIEQKLWERNTPYQGVVTNSAEPNNPYVKAQYYTLADANGNPQPKTKLTVDTIDKNGNDLQADEYDFFTSSVPDPVALPQSYPSLLRRTTQTAKYATASAQDGLEAVADSTNAYWNSSAPRTVGLIGSKSVLNGAGSTVARTDFGYDGNGNKISEARWDSTLQPNLPAQLDSGSASITTWSFSSDGRLTDIYDPNGNHTAFVFSTSYPLWTGGSGYLYPDERDDAAGTSNVRKTGFGYDFMTGLLTSQTDKDNNAVTSYGYNYLGRQSSSNEAGLKSTSTLYDDANRTITTNTDLRSFSDQAFTTITRYDGLGRVWLEQQTDDTGSAPGSPSDGIKVRTLYRVNSLGRWKAISNSYRNANDSTEATLGWTVIGQDRMGWQTMAAHYAGSAFPAPWGSNPNSLGTSTTAYNLETSTTTDEAGNKRLNINDALGRLKTVTEDPAGVAYLTSYVYDALDNLHQVTQTADPQGNPGLQQTRAFNYDSLSRLTSATNPESGTVSYTYYEDGDLKTKSSSGGTVTMGYDALRRISSKTYTVGAIADSPPDRSPVLL